MPGRLWELGLGLLALSAVAMAQSCNPYEDGSSARICVASPSDIRFPSSLNDRIVLDYGKVYTWRGVAPYNQGHQMGFADDVGGQPWAANTNGLGNDQLLTNKFGSVQLTPTLGVTPISFVFFCTVHGASDAFLTIEMRASCNDFAQNGDETGVDCGGSFCENCGEFHFRFGATSPSHTRCTCGRCRVFVERSFAEGQACALASQCAHHVPHIDLCSGAVFSPSSLHHMFFTPLPLPSGVQRAALMAFGTAMRRASTAEARATRAVGSSRPLPTVPLLRNMLTLPHASCTCMPLQHTPTTPLTLWITAPRAFRDLPGRYSQQGRERCRLRRELLRCLCVPWLTCVQWARLVWHRRRVHLLQPLEG